MALTLLNQYNFPSYYLGSRNSTIFETMVLRCRTEILGL